VPVVTVLVAIAVPSRSRRAVGVRPGLAVDPYGHGSAPIKGDADYRQAVIADAVVVYYVSSGVLTVTVARIVH
jgi:hypothetical protein